MATSAKMTKEPDLLPTHDRILEAATALFLKSGYAGTSMSAIAKASGIQKASLYHHFESKEAVLFACFERGYQATVERMRTIAGRTDQSYVERLVPLIDEIHGGIVRSSVGQMAPVVAETTSRHPQIARRFNDEFIAEMNAIAMAFVAEGIESGEFAAFELDALNHALFGIPVHLTMCQSMFGGFADLEQRYDIDRVKELHVMIVRKLLGL